MVYCLYLKQLLLAKGYKRLVLQIGRGEFIPQEDSAVALEVSHYRYKDTLAGDIQNADLVISHAGEVCCMSVCMSVYLPVCLLVCTLK